MTESQAHAVPMRSLLIATAILLALSAIFIAVELNGPMPRPHTSLDGKLTEVQKNAIGLIVDLAKLFMTWSLALIGGAGYFLKANIEKDYPLSRFDLFLAELVILISVISIFYGHLTINFIVTMLAVEILNLSDPALGMYIRVQYISFLLSLLTFGSYIHSTFFRRSTPTRTFPQSTEKRDNE